MQEIIIQEMQEVIKSATKRLDASNVPKEKDGKLLQLGERIDLLASQYDIYKEFFINNKDTYKVDKNKFKALTNLLLSYAPLIIQMIAVSSWLDDYIKHYKKDKLGLYDEAVIMRSKISNCIDEINKNQAFLLEGIGYGEKGNKKQGGGEEKNKT